MITEITIWQVWDRVRYAWRWKIVTDKEWFGIMESGMFSDKNHCICDVINRAAKDFGEIWTINKLLILSEIDS